mmetsp:Transcript_1881/g.5179  ORF Transcript_1881/g.5179 Transcript_1881/m.5179 type:complete len:221 (+) Transcript_1881:1233-1895(+)
MPVVLQQHQALANRLTRNLHVFVGSHEVVSRRVWLPGAGFALDLCGVWTDETQPRFGPQDAPDSVIHPLEWDLARLDRTGGVVDEADPISADHQHIHARIDGEGTVLDGASREVLAVFVVARPGVPVPVANKETVKVVRVLEDVCEEEWVAMHLDGVGASEGRHHALHTALLDARPIPPAVDVTQLSLGGNRVAVRQPTPAAPVTQPVLARRQHMGGGQE